MAVALRAAGRDSDSVARMRGEAFCVLLPGAEEAGADSVAVRMLDAVGRLHHPEIDGAPVTISIGLAVQEVPAEPMQALQRRLDQALYRTKAAGRDRVGRAEPAAGAGL